MRKTLLSLVAGALVTTGSLLVLGGGDANATFGGPTCNVPSDYSTIQAAVDDPGCSTVKVAQGTYNENVNINRSLVLKGAKSGVDVEGRTPAGPQESTVTGLADSPAITVSAPGVTINGFSITNPNHGLGITVKTVGNNTVIKHNIVDNIGSPSYSTNAVGVYLELGPDNVTVSENKISHAQSIRSAQGVLVGDSTSGNPSLGVVLNDNSVTDITSTTRGAYGIQLNNGASSAPTATGYTTAKITGNTIKNLNGAGWVHAIGLEGDTPNVVVRRNTISNLVSPSPDKVAVWFEDNVFFFTGDINRNSLAVTSTAYGIAVHPGLTSVYPTLSVDGTCNWWGASNGPSSVGTGSGSHVGPGVDSKPWLKSANLNGRCGNNDDHHDYNDHHFGHGQDDKDRGYFWDND